ncbi:hypothetical protein BC831DRAFT_401923 [Entophlyctis helioformis]|nr:hypothetical protein BC831DRAFT_401923 [Entophlyctis helioformis]
MNFLDANLDVLFAHLDESLASRILHAVWDRLLCVLELMIVPSLGEDPKERKPWDSKRLAFFAKFVEILETYFHADGAGLADEDIHSPSYRQLLHDDRVVRYPKQTLLLTYTQYKEQLMLQNARTVGPTPASAPATITPPTSPFAASPPSVSPVSAGEPRPQRIYVHDLDWILKLLKMRGARDFVDAELRDRLG